MKLYDLELSGNCYKVRLFAALANIELDIVPVDFLAGEHKSAEFLKLNPFGELPILDDNGFILRDSHSILIYLAGKYAGETWWPTAPQQQAEVSQWLFVTENEIQHGPCAARLIDLFNYPLDKQIALTKAEHILQLIDTHLSQHTWLAINRPTIADIAVYPYVALAHEGSIDLTPYVHIQAWMKRVQALPNYIAMPGL